MSEELIEVLNNFLKPILNLLGSINKKIGELVISQKAQMINEALQLESSGEVEKSNYTGMITGEQQVAKEIHEGEKALPELKEVNPLEPDGADPFEEEVFHFDNLKNDRKWILGKNKDGTPKLEWKVMGGGS